MRNTCRDDALIVGSGHSGLVLALGLAQDGWRVEMTTRNTLGELLGGPARITQAFLPLARAVERDLGLDLWMNSAPQVDRIEMVLASHDEPTVTFTSPLPGLATAVDRRLATAQWLQVLEQHDVVPLVQHSRAPHLEHLLRARPYDLTVMAPGANSDLADLFEVDGQRVAGASDRVIVQAHVETTDWGDQEPRIIMLSTEGAEVLIMPVLAYDPLSPQQVVAMSGEDPGAAARNLSIDPYWAVCVQVIARPDSRFAPTPRRAGERVHPEVEFAAAWAKAMDALERVAPQMADRYRHAPQVPGSTLIQPVTPQVRRPVTLLGQQPVLGIGDLTRTVEPASGQGAAVSTLVATTLRSRIREHRATSGTAELDAGFLREAWNAFDSEHGRHAGIFGAFVNAYWSRDHPHHRSVRAMVASLTHTPDQVQEWGAGINQPSRMAPLMAPLPTN